MIIKILIGLVIVAIALYFITKKKKDDSPCPKKMKLQDREPCILKNEGYTDVKFISDVNDPNTPYVCFQNKPAGRGFEAMKDGKKVWGVICDVRSDNYKVVTKDKPWKKWEK